MKTLRLTEDKFNNFTEDQLKRVLFVWYDGQGDTYFTEWKEISNNSILIEKERNKYYKTNIIFDTNCKKLDTMYIDNPINGNNSGLLYFDYDNEYKRIQIN